MKKILFVLQISFISVDKLFFISLKIVRFPIAAPIPAINPISSRDRVSECIIIINAPVAAVKVETKRIPQINATR